MKKGKLILQDGSVYEGISFGSEVSKNGEIVFSTAMVGYPESLTDPSYNSQILVSTYPLIGNYGVPKTEYEDGLIKNFESEKIHVSGLIVSEYSENYSHWKAEKSLSDWLKENNIPALYGIDTRELTVKLREHGSMPAKIIFDEDLYFTDLGNQNLVNNVSTKEVITYGKGEKTVVLVDCGVKYNIIRCLMSYEIKVIRVPWNYDFTKLEYDGVLISNGPGNPKMCVETIQNVKKAFEIEKPIMGICLGNQIIGLAAGSDTYKLKYGHRSHNQPVQLVGTNRVFMSSQNHGYALDDSKLPDKWEIFFKNLNDNTNEGIKHKNKPFFSVQFHPEAASGPNDTKFLFDEFIKLI
jgi:carbamoyl-phosphate synthase small subunit